MKLNLGDFSKVNENENHIQLKHKKHDHMLTIAKNSLSPKMKSEFAAMPHMAEGGETPAQAEEPGFFDKLGSLFEDKNQPPPTMNAAAPASPPVDPDTQGKRDLYNQFVSNNFSDPYGMPNPMAGSGVLFENGQIPSNFNKEAWENASQKYDAEKAGKIKMDIEAQQDAYQDALKENAARSQAGLPQVAQPPAPPQLPDYKYASYDQTGMQMPQNPDVPQVPQAAGQINPMIGSQQNMLAGLTNAFKEQQAGINKEAQAMGELGRQQAQAAQEQQRSAEALQTHQQQAYNALMDERSNLMKDYQNGTIKPQHYLESMGTGAKVGTAIGILMSGLGSGLAGQENMAMGFLNNQINKDIDAQKANLGIKENLLNANYKQFGNMHDAMNMTRAMQNDIYASKIAQAAANVQDPLAKAKALQLSGQLHERSTQVMSQMSLRLGAMQGLRSGQVDPAMAIQYMAPEGERKALMGDLQDMQNTVKFRDDLLSAWDKVEKLNTAKNWALHPLDTSAQIDALKKPLTAALSKGTAGRFTESDAGMLDPLWPKGWTGEKANQTLRAAINKIATQKMNFPSLSPYGITPERYGRYGTQGQNKVNFTPRGQ